MLSIRTNIPYSSPLAPASSTLLIPANLRAPPEEELKVCPHCGGDLKQSADNTFNFQTHEIVIRSRRSESRLWRRPVQPKTWSLLEYLLQNIGKFRSTEQVHMVCFDEEVDTGIVTVQVGALRKLLDGTPYFIETKYGVGYRLLRR